MRRMNPAEILSRFKPQSPLAGRHGGHAAGVAKARVSARRALAHQVLQGLQRQGVTTPTLDQFLAVLDSVDNQAADAVRTALRQLGLTNLDQDLVQSMRLAASPQALHVVGDVIAALRLCQPAAQSGVTADELAGDCDRRVALGEMTKVVGWAQDKVRTGKQVLETWQAEAQAEIASQFLLALAAAPDEAAYLSLVRDGSEVIDLEVARLQALLQVRQANAGQREDLQGQVALKEKEAQLLQVLQDLRDEKPVPPALLQEMAQFYAENPWVLDDAPAASPPAATPAAAPPAAAARRQTARA